MATLGPATDDVAVLEELIRAGADDLRINFSHGDADDQATRVETVRKVAAKVGINVAVMGDLQGPKIRIESFVSSPITLNDGSELTYLGDGDTVIIRGSCASEGTPIIGFGECAGRVR